MTNSNRRYASLLAKASRIAVCTIAILVLGNSKAMGFTYEPWTDLSHHFNLHAIRNYGSSYIFNSYDMTSGCIPFTSERIDNQQYYATVLGRNVWLRTSPTISSYTQLCQVNTGDNLTVINTIGYANGKHWSYVRVTSGYRTGSEGYICTDFIIDHQMYQALHNYVFSSRSNISSSTQSKYLNAIAAILLKFDVNAYRPRLSVTMLNSVRTGYGTIVPFRIYNSDAYGNNSMLAFVRFANNSNNYTVIGIAPGRYVYNITPLSNGSYNITFGM